MAMISMKDMMRADRIKNEKDESIDFKELEENYSHYLEKKLPPFLHRGDIHQTTRLLGYADAMLATCATFLIIPLRNLNGLNENETLGEFLTNSIPNSVSFIIGFLLVSTLWESVNIRSSLVKHVDDFYVMLMIIYLLLVCLIPFSLGLMGQYYDYNTSIFVFCFVLISVELLEIVMNIYAFRTPRLLHMYIQRYTKEELAHAKTMMCLKNVVNIVLCSIACGAVFLDYKVSWVFIAFMLLLPYIRKGIFFVHRKIYGYPTNELCIFFTRFKKGNISKDRVEAFTDAAVAILACVLILDITVEGFPGKIEVAKNGLNYSLKHRFDEFVIFVMTYLAISTLWYVNHTVLQLFHTINVVILTLQKILLVSICWIPLASQMVHKYIKKANRETTIAVRFCTIVMLMGSFCNLLMFIWGLYVKDKVFHGWANFNNNLRTNCRKHLYILLKLSNAPFWCLICLFGTFGPAKYVSMVMGITVACKMVTFVILKLIFVNHIGHDGIFRDLVDNEIGVNSVDGNSALSQSNNIIIENSFVNQVADIDDVSIEEEKDLPGKRKMKEKTFEKQRDNVSKEEERDLPGKRKMKEKTFEKLRVDVSEEFGFGLTDKRKMKEKTFEKQRDDVSNEFGFGFAWQMEHEEKIFEKLRYDVSKEEEGDLPGKRKMKEKTFEKLRVDVSEEFGFGFAWQKENEGENI